MIWQTLVQQQQRWVAGVAKDVQNIRLLEIDMRFFSNVVIGLEALPIDTAGKSEW